MTTKWTPGPWKYEEELRANMSSIIGDDRVVAAIPNEFEFDGDEGLAAQRANAHLIAAAPALYEALDDVLRWAAERYGDKLPLEFGAAKRALRVARGDDGKDTE